MGRNFKNPIGLLVVSVLVIYLKNSDSVSMQDRLRPGHRLSRLFGRGNLMKAEQEKNQRMEQIFAIRENYTDSNKYLLIDDMIISKDKSRAGLLNAAWPSGVVPFTYALTFAPQQRLIISQAITELSSRTCIQFRPARQDDAYWVVFQNDPMNQGCSSFVGWQNRKNQPIQLSTQCSRGNAIHEIIHALGYFHEQSRNDRDEYVKINIENVNPGYENNFKKESEMDPPPETVNYGNYNYDSIMGYGKFFFSKNGQPTIEPLNNPAATGNGDNIGQRDFLSPGDVSMLNKKYNCPTLANIEGEIASTTIKPSPLNPMCQFTPSLPICFVR